jgi:pilus assembly protein Flp/PilA
MDRFKRTLGQLARADDGATAIEYGLIAGLIAGVIILSIATMGDNFAAAFNFLGAELDPANIPGSN